MGDKIFNVLGSIVVLATITTLVLPGRGTAGVIKAGGNAFTGAIKAGITGK
jgi:hypothetical protein